MLYIVFTFIMSDVFLFISFSIFYTIFYSSSFFISFILNIASINAITNIELSVAETLVTETVSVPEDTFFLMQPMS